jgi:hypothetical protein
MISKFRLDHSVGRCLWSTKLERKRKEVIIVTFSWTENVVVLVNSMNSFDLCSWYSALMWHNEPEGSLTTAWVTLFCVTSPHSGNTYVVEFSVASVCSSWVQRRCAIRWMNGVSRSRTVPRTSCSRPAVSLLLIWMHPNVDSLALRENLHTEGHQTSTSELCETRCPWKCLHALLLFYFIILWGPWQKIKWNGSINSVLKALFSLKWNLSNAVLFLFLYLYSLFNEDFSSSEYIMSNGKVICEWWKGCWRKRSWSNLSYYPGIYLKGLRKTTWNLNQGSRSPNRDLNLIPPEYEANHTTTTFDRCI